MIALIMVMALAGTALAFNPPDNEDASGLCGVDLFPAREVLPGGANPPGVTGGGGPWNATDAGASENPGVGIDFKNEGTELC